MSTNTTQSPGTSRISSFVFIVTLVVVVLSFVAFALAAFLFETNSMEAILFIAIGAFALILASYYLLQSRRVAATTKLGPAKVMTTVECKKCGLKTVRDFQRGDYVYKELEACQKCPDDKMIITAIYKEVKEKEKTYNF
jgi:hypothetical protein